MANGRLTVRVSRAVFEQIDRVLGPERGPHGQPSAADFLTVELLAIVEVFATRFDELPEAVPGRPDYRLLVSAAVLVPAVAVVRQITADGSVELIGIQFDLERGW